MAHWKEVGEEQTHQELLFRFKVYYNFQRKNRDSLIFVRTCLKRIYPFSCY